VKAIDAVGVGKSFPLGFFQRGRKTVLQDVSLSVEAGVIHSILGPNGAGKTTLLSILSTLLLPDSGRIRVLGREIPREEREVQGLINVSSGNPNFLWSLTVYENLNFYGMLYGLVGRERRSRVEEAIALLELEPNRDASFDELSTGTKQRLSLAKALLNHPRLLFLDEPTVGLDPRISRKIRGLIREVHEEKGITILLTTHYMREAEELSDRITFLRRGRVLVEGTPEDLKGRIRVGELIRVDLEREGSDADLSALLGGLPGVMDLRFSEGTVCLTVDRAEERLDRIIGALRGSGAVIRGLRVSEPNLEDVFLEFSQ
jgi:ABC-2 type transport system ATP-binding protein